VIPTDTMKNVAYVVANERPLDSLETYGAALTAHFLDHYTHVEVATVRLSEQPLDRIEVAGDEDAYAFYGTRSERRTTHIRRTRAGVRLKSGLDDLFLLKTQNTAFAGFHRDRYTPLPETEDRLLATALKADWLYAASAGEPDWNDTYRRIRTALLATFAT